MHQTKIPLTLSVRGPSLDDRIWRLKSIPALKDFLWWFEIKKKNLWYPRFTQNYFSVVRLNFDMWKNVSYQTNTEPYLSHNHSSACKFVQPLDKVPIVDYLA